MTPERTEQIRAAQKRQDELREQADHAAGVAADVRKGIAVQTVYRSIRFDDQTRQSFLAFLDDWAARSAREAAEFQIPPEGSP